MSGTQTKASPSDIRISNITAAFKQLFPATQISRANIGKLIGLSRFTTSEVTGEMVDNRILRELGPDNREGRGKRSQVLAIDTDFWRIVSIDLSNPNSPKERWRIFPAESWTAPNFLQTTVAASMM